MTANDPRYEGVVGRARFLQDRCRDILLSNDPVSRILRDESKCAPGNAEVQSNLELIGESKVKNLDPKAVADEVPNTVRVLDSVGKDNCNPPSVGGDWWWRLQFSAAWQEVLSESP